MLLTRNNEWKIVEGILKKYGNLGVCPPIGWAPLGAGGAAVATQQEPTVFGQQVCCDILYYHLCDFSHRFNARGVGFWFDSACSSTRVYFLISVGLGGTLFVSASFFVRLASFLRINKRRKRPK